MQSESRAISSNQSEPHPRLADIVARHARCDYLKPLSPYGDRPFEQAMTAWQLHGGALMIDAGCGVGLSTRRLAQQSPDAFVIGVDQSAHRLGRRNRWDGPAPDNFITVRAELVDFWQRLALANVQPFRQYLLYPNPWPKKSQLQRRWHAHPIFPTLLRLGGYIECRSNWKIYIDEMAAAFTQLTGLEVNTEHFSLPATGALTPFEQKYAASGHALWRCSLDLPRPL
ncbi:MAG: tRNA (guanine(46)-N(7))-methyltransferase TrmB [Burkholderiaceae bacterium]